ncbi:insulinase family protein [Murdochiella sp. Marseille-P8839]|nr:insulinase family protein [Murdochiella sp. Marseille-P8839]
MNEFRLLRSELIAEEQTTYQQYVHEKTGAQVFWLKNDDPNKMFAIAFPTLPIGSTGNMHILEHAVLNGSRKFRTKEPFWDLLKSSLQTFLNAMTFPDRTVYPVASRNDTDFMHLTEMYLDAVFYPQAVQDPLIFEQEGWHKEIFSAEEPITYKGVVYNEMRGDMSAPEQQVIQQIQQALLPDTPYANNAGGDPYEIPTLRYEEFCAYHQEYYHPSNAKVFLYGAIPEEDVFTLIASYFSAFSQRTMNTLSAKQTPFSAPKEAEFTFSVADGEETENRDFLALSWLVDEARTDSVRYLNQMLSDVLIDAESSPLRRRLFAELQPADVLASEMSYRDVSFLLLVKHVDASKKERFEQIVLETLEQIVRDGIDPEIWEGVLHRMEFDLREKNGRATKAITFLFALLNEGIYGLDPAPILHYEDQLHELRELLRHGALERYIEERLLKNPHRVLSVHRPEPGKNARKDAEVAKALAREKEKMSADELDALIAENRRLRDRQNRSDTEEEKATIPVLTRDVLPQTLEKTPRRVTKSGADTLLFHDLPTAGINYLIVSFALSGFTQDELPYVALAADLFGGLDTENYSYREYDKAEHRFTGGITVTPTIFSKEDSEEICRTLLVEMPVMGKENNDRAFALLEEQLLRTLWTDKERMQELIRIRYTSFVQQMVYAGNTYASECALAKHNAAAYYRQAVSGLTYFRFLERLNQHFSEEDRTKLEEVAHRLFSAAGRVINVTGHGKEGEAFLERARQVVSAIPTTDTIEKAWTFAPACAAEAYSATSDVQYNAVAAPFIKPESLHGSLFVLMNILNNSLLYNEIRAKGGAYGQSALFTTDGNVIMSSFRDPQLDATYRVFADVGKAVSALSLTPKDIDRFVVGAVGQMDRPLTDEQKGRRDLLDFLRHRDIAREDRYLQEVLRTRAEDLRAWGETLSRAMMNASKVTIGNAEAIHASETPFDIVERLS